MSPDAGRPAVPPAGEGGRVLALGDIHGAARALDQVFERSGFDPGRDRLICLGDICDGWPEVDRCFDLLLGLDRLTLILGNHDEWAAAWMQRGEPPLGWYAQGGDATVDAYAVRAGVDPPMDPRSARALARRVPPEHARLLESALPYLIEMGDDGLRRLFTHAGWNPGRAPASQDPYDLRLGRELWTQARLLERMGAGAGRRLTDYDEVYIGHTPTDWREPRPVLEIWNLDQGAGWDGVLTLMDVRSHESWQSDPVPGLYPGVQGR
ncbi:MAG TPA: metallophosphoesterase [Longimicrobiales bacterium]|nr:metallophosphoesterase [Longimicrobiales bacterium]